MLLLLGDGILFESIFMFFVELSVVALENWLELDLFVFSDEAVNMFLLLLPTVGTWRLLLLDEVMFFG